MRERTDELAQKNASLQAEISERQRAEEQIKSQLAQLQRWHDVTLDREDRVQELKREVNGFCRRIGEPRRYLSQEADSPDCEAAKLA